MHEIAGTWLSYGQTLQLELSKILNRIKMYTGSQNTRSISTIYAVDKLNNKH